MRWTFTFSASLLTLAACGSTAEEPEGGATGPSCGGDLVEFWQGSYLLDEPEGTTDPCHKLQPERQPDGRVFVGLSYPPPEQRMVSFQFRDDTTFSLRSTAHGSVRQSYAAACLSNGNLTVTCDEVVAGLEIVGGGEGGIGNVECTVATGPMGGCDCSWDVFYGRGVSADGAWSTSDANLTLILDQVFGHELLQGDEMIQASYCIEQDSLQLSAAINQLVPGFGSTRLVPTVTCVNGQQDTFETGVDCGGPCGTTCP
ncbi:MAG TPA: hypothetical protein VHO25_15430 [Polyangiaceae bacterium]|nr:hypothetical protein [Polyangiaceae bacterium]